MYINGKPVNKKEKKEKIDPNTLLPIEEEKEIGVKYVGVKPVRRAVEERDLPEEKQRELDF